MNKCDGLHWRQPGNRESGLTYGWRNAYVLIRFAPCCEAAFPLIRRWLPGMSPSGRHRMRLALSARLKAAAAAEYRGSSDRTEARRVAVAFPPVNMGMSFIDHFGSRNADVRYWPSSDAIPASDGQMNNAHASAQDPKALILPPRCRMSRRGLRRAALRVIPVGINMEMVGGAGGFL